MAPTMDAQHEKSVSGDCPSVLQIERHNRLSICLFLPRSTSSYLQLKIHLCQPIYSQRFIIQLVNTLAKRKK